MRELDTLEGTWLVEFRENQRNYNFFKQLSVWVKNFEHWLIGYMEKQRQVTLSKILITNNSIISISMWIEILPLLNQQLNNSDIPRIWTHDVRTQPGYSERSKL